MDPKVPKVQTSQVVLKLKKPTKQPRFQVKSLIKRAKAELLRLKAETARETSGKMEFNFTPKFDEGAFEFKAPPSPQVTEEPMEVAECPVKKELDSDIEAEPESDLAKLPLLQKRYVSCLS